MSIESARAFYARMTTDEAFRRQLEQAASKEERQQILSVLIRAKQSLDIAEITATLWD